jgi:hypothetical protein
MSSIIGVKHVGIGVRNMEIMKAFYGSTLGYTAGTLMVLFK